MTAEQLEASRAERLRQNGYGTITLEDARTWIEETGLCLFQPKRQAVASVAPSFVEAVAGKRETNPDPRHIAIAEELLVRLELEGVAVRLNLLGQVGEQPDYIVAAWVLPYVYALRGDRDWRRNPQLTGSRQVSQLAVLTYKLLEAADTTIPNLKTALGREVTETAVTRAITELWQQLRIIPVIAAPGQAPKWQLLRHRFQKAIAEGASTSQVTAISVLASIYLQAVIAASMEEVELFLAPLTARSKVREVLRGLVATRQVHTISMGHAPHFYVAGTLPEFSVVTSIYTSSSIASTAYFLNNHEDETPEPEPVRTLTPPRPVETQTLALAAKAEETPAPVAKAKEHRPAGNAAHNHRKPLATGKPAAARPHFSRTGSHGRDRKPAQSAGSHQAGSARPVNGARTANGTRPTANGARWNVKPAKSSEAQRNSHPAGKASANGKTANRSSNGSANGASGRSAASRPAKATAPAWNQRSGHAKNAKSSAQAGPSARSGSAVRHGARPSKDSRSSTRTSARPAARPTGRTDSRPSRSSARGNRSAVVAKSTKTAVAKRFSSGARSKQGTKKR